MATTNETTAKSDTLNFKSAWNLEEMQRVINAQERAFPFADGHTAPAELVSFSEDETGKTNVGTFEERTAAPTRPVVLRGEIPTDLDDREAFFLTLGRRGLELICFCDALIKDTPTELAVCRSIADEAADPTRPPTAATTATPAAPATPTTPPTPAPATPANPVPPAPPAVTTTPAASGLMSEDAFNLILEFEGVDQPGRWPGASSGVTLGVGYDLGFYSAAQFASDWGRHLTSSQISRLKNAIGLKGQAAHREAPRYSDIKISRASALEVFNRCTLPLHTKKTHDAFPGMEKLPLNAQGALVSLVFNRGPAMGDGSRREMTAIRQIIRDANLPQDQDAVLQKIAGQIRSMKRLWDIDTMRGLHRRRDAEAEMIANAGKKPGSLIQLAGAAVVNATAAAVVGAVAAVLPGGATGEKLVELARKHCNVGEKYRLGAFVPKDKSDVTGPWDCAEFVSWCTYQVAGVLYGCEEGVTNPTIADAYTGYWQRDARSLGRVISVAEAARIPGAVVLRFPPSAGPGHIALSDGQGGTLEAKGTNFGVVTDKIDGRRWDIGVLIPGIAYQQPGGSFQVGQTAKAYFVGAPGMSKPVVTSIQQSLQRAGFNPGTIDGDFGDATAEAVLAFQSANNLMADGEVGPETAKALGVTV